MSDGAKSFEPETSVGTSLVSDLVGSAAWIENLGDAGAARDLHPAYEDLEVKKSSGFSISFPRPNQAAALASNDHQASAQGKQNLSRRGRGGDAGS